MTICLSSSWDVQFRHPKFHPLPQLLHCWQRRWFTVVCEVLSLQPASLYSTEGISSITLPAISSKIVWSRQRFQPLLLVTGKSGTRQLCAVTACINVTRVVFFLVLGVYCFDTNINISMHFPWQICFLPFLFRHSFVYTINGDLHIEKLIVTKTSSTRSLPEIQEKNSYLKEEKYHLLVLLLIIFC